MITELASASRAVAPLPVPRTAQALSFRLATREDIPTLDALQKPYSKALGHFKTGWFEGYTKMGAVLVAECGGTIVGYCISRDRYLKRDELGIIFQLCVAAGDQRKLVGAALVREVFARSAYGCKLYCLWCAQDLDANYFWQSMGFSPVAFRTGSGRKRRMHIFWERRIREGDTTTPYWFPAQTSGGAIAEDRIVLPIPPNTHWRDVMPIILPGEESTKLHGPNHKQARSSKCKIQNAAPPPPMRRRMQFGPPGSSPPPAPEPAPAVEKVKPAKKPKQKNDPLFVAKARDLRDRYLEHVNSGQLQLAAAGKYDVSRQIAAADIEPAHAKQIPLLPAA